jgi:hypothetical protein
LKIGSILLAAALALPAVANAGTITGSSNGFTYTATNKIIGQTSTATVAGGGNPIYLAQKPQYRGVVGLLLDYGSAGAFVCSGSLIAGGTSILTAAHCVNNGGVKPSSVTAFFYDGNAADQPVYNAGAAGVTTVDTSYIFINPLYTGEVIDDHDIAVIRLAAPAPSFGNVYDLYTGSDLIGQSYNIAGYGVRSDTGGDVGANLGTGRLRQGTNTYDFTLGDPIFGGLFDGGPNGFFGNAETTNSLISDFDNGLVANDASCALAGAFGAGGPQFCSNGVSPREVSSGGGDSGGPQFIDGKIASVTSYGLTSGPNFGDIDNRFNHSFGEFNGFVGIYNNLGFINSVVPEPSSWAMLIAGFGLVGGAARRRRSGAAITA